ncbi:MAG: DEAD/DEAH box helicase family protein [Gammaproteobacteria bacterium]|nr:DEAD/DEAH box helicase family protein [Gammaproteobacteria bacterium]
MAIELRHYQRAAIDSLYEYWGREKGNPLIVAPCGAGKSLVIAFFIREAMQYPDTRIICMTHRKELLEQNEAELRGIWPDAPTGFYSAGIGRRDRHAPILFAGIQSVAKKIHTFDPFEICIVDECHLIPRAQSTQYGLALETLKLMNPRTRFVGLTASPYRLDSGLLHEGEGALFDQITYEIPVRQLIDEGHLCEVVGKRGAEVADLSGVHRRGGEFIAAEVERAFDREDLTAAACDEIVRYGANRRAWLVFASGIDHAEHVRDAIRERGVDCEVVHGGIGKTERAEIIERFRAGRLRCLVNVDILTIGFNAPICDMGVLLRATESTALYVQIVGRLMRTYPGKSSALLLDFGGNVERHGPIDRVNVRRPSEGGGEAPAKSCPECNSLVHASALECPDCGHTFPERKPRHDGTAYAGAVMSHQEAGQWLQVDAVRYHLHKKLGKPDSVRVEYRCGIRIYRDWWTPEHRGIARTQTVKRLWEHGIECPRTTNELLGIAAELPVPATIEVKPDGRYERVTAVDFGGERPANAGKARVA